MILETTFNDQHARLPFSGVLSIRRGEEILFSRARGLAHRPAARKFRLNTRAGTASGSKTFTAAAICKLVDQGRLAFDAPLRDFVDSGLDPGITIHHLLCHTAGNPDYFDEEVDDDYEALWKERPMYAFRRPADFLPLFQDRAAKYAPGARFAYSNAGYILLGLVVERLSQMPFPRCIEELVFQPCSMVDSGYFRLDALPERTAAGYIREPDGTHRSNIYSIPIIGGGDGGAFTTLEDLHRFWETLLGGRLISPPVLERMLFPHVQVDPGQPDDWYGYGLWISRRNEAVRSWYMLGEDPGVAFCSARYPGRNLEFSLMGNLVPNAWGMLEALLPLLRDEVVS